MSTNHTQAHFWYLLSLEKPRDGLFYSGIMLDLFTSGMNEDQFRIHVLTQLKNDFDYKIEVHGIDAGGNDRYLDAVITAKQHLKFREYPTSFGIEFKEPERNPKLGKATSLINQAMIYTYTKWDGYGRLPIFMCELNIRSSDPCIDRINYVFRRIMGTFNVGTIDVQGDTITLSMSDAPIYTSGKGVTHVGTQWKKDNTL